MKKLVILAMSILCLTTLTVMSFKTINVSSNSRNLKEGRKNMIGIIEVKGHRYWDDKKQDCIGTSGNCLKDVIVNSKMMDMILNLKTSEQVSDFFNGNNWQSYFPEVIDNDGLLNNLRNGQIKFEDSFNKVKITHFYLGTNVNSGELILVSPFIVE